MKKTSFWTKVVVLVFSVTAHAAIDNSSVRNERGLFLNIKNPHWIFLSPTEIDSPGVLLVARPKAQGKISLTWRVDAPDTTPANAQRYAEKWLKEYPKFGFELESSGEAKYGALQGYEIELKDQTGQKKLKQFIVQRNKEFWVFTCSATFGEFKSAWNGCRKILLTAKLAK